MIKSVLNKITNNLWLFTCLIIGSLLITTILTSIPIYTDGAMRKMLDKELNAYQENNQKNPGEFFTQIRFTNDYSSRNVMDHISKGRKKIHEGLLDRGFVYNAYYERFTVEKLKNENTPALRHSTLYKLESLSGLKEHVRLIEGAFPSETAADGVIEVMVSAATFNAASAQLGREYSFRLSSLPDEISPVFTVRLVGVYTPLSENEPYWYEADKEFALSFFADPEAFEDYILTSQNATYVTSASWYHHVNFYGLKLEDLSPFIEFYNETYAYLENFGPGKFQFAFPLRSTIVSYAQKSAEMQVTMWVLNAPVLVILAFYIFMVSKMIIEEDKNEISSLRSRGARPVQIFGRYVVECGIIVLISLLIGPPLGLLLAQGIGSANGFLEFVNRTKLSVGLSFDAYLYAIAGGLLFMLTVLIPAYLATKRTIVQHKQQKARKRKKPLWEKLFLDIILLAVSIYLLYLYGRLGITNTSGGIDPIVYFISTLFIISCGLVFLRLYPYLLKLIFRLTQKKLPPTVYATFIQVSRGGNENRFLILFLILSMAIGIYSSSSARIINNNAEESALYISGADLIFQPVFDDADADGPSAYKQVNTDRYLEIDGLESFARVATVDGVCAKSQYNYVWDLVDTRVMGIDPYEFAQVAWLRSGLTESHWYYYINMMEEFPTAVLISSNLASRQHLKEGDTVQVNLDGDHIIQSEAGNSYIDCYVMGIIDYWPTYYDDPGNKWDDDRELIVMNMDYLQYAQNDVAYSLWFRKSADVSSRQIVEAMQATGLYDEIASITDRTVIMNTEKSDSLLTALNGSFSLGFVATMVISLLGFLLYWLLSVRKRRLQFGVLRAMGMTKRKITLMMIWEHLITSGVAVLVGVIIGMLTVRLFIPLIEMTYQASVLPLRIVYSSADSLRIFGIVLFMLAAGIGVLTGFINKLKINEAVKIGEE